MWAWRSITAAYDRARMFRSIVVGTDGSETARRRSARRPTLAAARRAPARARLRLRAGRRQRLREEAREAPGDLQWMINPREDVDATLREAAAEVEEAGVG